MSNNNQEQTLRIGTSVHLAMNAYPYQIGTIVDIDTSRVNGDFYAVAFDGVVFDDGTNINFYRKEQLEVVDAQ